ncbi:transport system permease protein [Catenulispora acidiphila DSM 44928]|uniref:Transport system permease protein n=1 Tax=Catenulispora acidiphila (strain DSM 44928 / JCM 14897 / NBRC 102108 / NRRL B-24433 / ID139908) TaxID=479433 RepID=C7Q3Q9_CATAD|nr:iron ABC transporter permease [Catenulispora acidiphila]ACU77667.1 transport system permease protein [Catenulispora acidiphila DSM 44928]
MGQASADANAAAGQTAAARANPSAGEAARGSETPPMLAAGGIGEAEGSLPARADLSAGATNSPNLSSGLPTHADPAGSRAGADRLLSAGAELLIAGPGGVDRSGDSSPRRLARPTIALLVGTVVLLASILVASLGGAAGLPVGGTAEALLDKLPFVDLHTGLGPLQQSVLDQIRLPRVVLATLVGALLAQAGAAYQGVFRNPLSDSGTIGASAGAGMAATLVIVFGGGPEHTVAGIGAVPLAAFVGALGGVLTSYVLGTLVGRGGTAALILAGVAVSSFAGAVQAFVMQRSTTDVRQVYSWLFGSFAAADWSLVRLALPYAVISVLIVTVHARHLDVLALGDDEAATLGLNPVRTRLIVLAAASLATATAVAVSGIIGFVGLVVPHVVRRVAGPGHRLLLPMSLLVGGAFLVLADLLARTVLAPAELPIGVVTSFVGAPFFLVILRATRERDR